MSTLSQTIAKTFIIAHREDTQTLTQFLTQENLNPEVCRQAPDPNLADASPSYRCLLNHRSTWEKILYLDRPALIIEADFVPVQGIGQLPLPCPIDLSNTGVAWLYTCAPQIYTVSPEGYAEGFSVSTVAYLVTPIAAQHLITLADRIHNNHGPQLYTSWDSQIEETLRKQGLKNYVAFRNYGEHGGRPNLEHRNHGLSTAHRADILYGRLAFRPPYAQNTFDLLLTRSQARLKGLLRLLSGRYLRVPVLRRSSIPLRLLRFALQRQFTLTL
ncbi:LPS biosynthesis glycosyltransferase [Alkalinema pantanalense CENA528]|uniref:LPS biosynthesis glycosyltransferase n=1 Tax=Alkalinema pantanalense TaxID=1620705 RepID=UPI003D6F2342